MNNRPHTDSRPTWAPDPQCVTAGPVLCSTLCDVRTILRVYAFLPVRRAFTTFLVLTHISQNALDFCLTVETHRRGGAGGKVEDQDISFTFARPADCEEAEAEGGGSSGCWGSTGAGAVSAGAVGLSGEGSHIDCWLKCCLL